MNKKLHGNAAHLYEVFTLKGGVQNYKSEIEANAYLKFAFLCLCINLMKAGCNKIENIKPRIDQFH